jgi:hypothetical protein
MKNLVASGFLPAAIALSAASSFNAPAQAPNPPRAGREAALDQLKR